MMPATPLRYGQAPPREGSPEDGVLLVDKPRGPTSHDVVAAVRRRFRIKKVGHGGTLDPMATGLLILLLGKGTKLSSVFIGSDKTYTGTMRLGVTTNTQDADGQVEQEREVAGLTEAQVKARMQAMTGDQFQTPPMVSAIKIDGVPLYKRARNGEEVERKPRFIHLYEFRLTEFALPHVSFVVRCTKGTYVRTLCADLGEALGCGAHLNALRRTACGKLSVDEAIALESLLELDRERLFARMLPLVRFATQLPRT